MNNTFVIILIIAGFALAIYLVIKFGETPEGSASGGDDDHSLTDNPASKKGAAPPEVKTHLERAAELCQDLQYLEAIKEVEQAIRKNPRDAELHFRLGRIYQIIEDYAQAETSFKTAFRINPDMTEALFELSRACWKQEKLDVALDHINHYLNRRPKNREAQKIKARIYMDKEAYNDARLTLEPLSKQERDNLEIQILYARTLLLLDMPTEANDLFVELETEKEIEPENLRFQFAVLYQQFERHEEATSFLDNIRQLGNVVIQPEVLNAELTKCWSNRAIQLMAENDFAMAKAALQQAELYNPEAPEIFAGYGKLHTEEKHYPEAIASYQQALEKDHPSRVNILMALAAVYEKNDQFDEAIECIKEVEATAATAETYYHLGTLYGLKGDFPTCIIYLTKAVQRNRYYTNAFYNLAVAQEKTRALDDALKTYEKVLELDKDFMEARANYRSLKKRLNQM